MQLQNLKEGDLTVTQYLHKAKLISDELTAAGHPLCLADQNIYIFKGLRSEFKDIVTTLSARPQPVTFTKLHSLLLNHEFIYGLSLSNLSISSTPQQPADSVQYPPANLTHRNTQSDRSYNNNTNRGRGRSNRGCGGRFNSRNDSTYSQPWQSTDQRQKCQICNDHNHTAPNCFQRYSQNTNPVAYLSHSTPNAASQQWFPDTGATNHISPDLTTFHQIEDYKGADQVHVGNGNCVHVDSFSSSLALNLILPMYFFVKVVLTKEAAWPNRL